MGKVFLQFRILEALTNLYECRSYRDLTGDYYPAADYEALEAETSKLRQAIGLATTCAPKMEMDVADPIGMMRVVCAEFKALEAKLAAAINDGRAVQSERDASINGSIETVGELLDVKAKLAALEKRLQAHQTEK